jgi:anthranilate synthase component 1
VLRVLDLEDEAHSQLADARQFRHRAREHQVPPFQLGRQGLLQPGLSSLDVLRATFPAGTLTGAPKIRAMEIIDELEPVKRGIYGGACGYLSFAGDMDVAIAIRTGIVKDQVLYVQAAAGVVADSVPELEWKETEAKARALIRAAELVEEGF